MWQTKHASTKGFTLIELVVVIVILGILAATALPKFVDLGKDARIAQVNALAGTLKSTAEMWRGVCEINGFCQNPTGVFTYQGKNVWYYNRYPDAGDSINDRQIDSLIDATGFTVSLDNTAVTRFSLKGAPTPANCAVTYQVAGLNATTGVVTPPTIVTYTSGCE